MKKTMKFSIILHDIGELIQGEYDEYEHREDIILIKLSPKTQKTED
jgi:hypothetical protein